MKATVAPIFAAATLLLSSALMSPQAPVPIPQTSTPAGQQQKEPEPCTVSGRVMAAADGAPLQSARVGLIENGEQRRPAVYGTVTDANGHFEIKKVPPGRYRFVASHTGFISQQYQAQGLKGGAVLALSPGQTIDDAMFRLTRAAAISGRIADEAGGPMMGVAVSALRKSTPDEDEELHHRSKREHLLQASSAVTDDRGEYRVFGLKPGEYYLKASESPDELFTRTRGMDMLDEDYELVHEMASHYAPLYYPGVLQMSEAQSVSLSAGEEMQADFTMRHVKTVQVSGHVIGSDGKPATRAYVNLRLPDVDDDLDLGSMTDEKGEFVIKGASPGNYILNAQHHADGRHEFLQQKIEVGDANVDNLMLSFGTGTDVKGRITASAAGVAFDRMRVRLTPLDDDAMMGGWAEVKPDGTFEIANVPDGSFILHAGAGQPGWYVKSARMGASDVLQKGVQIERGATGGSLEIVLSSAAAQLEGAVTQDNKPVMGAEIRVRPEPETSYNGMLARGSETDQNGHFSIQTVAPGQYKVIAKLPSGTSEVPALASEPQIVTLGEHDHQTVQLTLPKPEE